MIFYLLGELSPSSAELFLCNSSKMGRSSFPKTLHNKMDLLKNQNKVVLFFTYLVKYILPIITGWLHLGTWNTRCAFYAIVIVHMLQLYICIQLCLIFLKRFSLLFIFIYMSIYIYICMYL